MRSRVLWVIASALVLVLEVSCGGGGWYSFEGYGQLVVRLADAPVDDALAVVVRIDDVDAKISNATNPTYQYTRFRLRPVFQMDLTTLTAGRSVVLVQDESVEADRWNWIRLVIRANGEGRDSWIDTATGRHALYLPDGFEDHRTIHEPFYVPKDGVLDLTIDFDLRQSIIPPQVPGGPYFLDPILRMVETDQAGSIEGTVDPTLAVGGSCSPVVYGFSGTGVSPDDIDRTAPEPITEGTVSLDNDSGELRWSLDWLPAGDYTVALTCQGDLDRPDRDDTPDVGFQVIKTAAVVAGETTHLDL